MSVKSLLKFFYFLFMQNVILRVKMEEDVHDTWGAGAQMGGMAQVVNNVGNPCIPIIVE